MCYVVIAGGPNKDLSRILPRITSAEKIICADSGADALLPYDIVPDMVWGDMDSIRPETRAFLEKTNALHYTDQSLPIKSKKQSCHFCKPSHT